MVGGKRYYYFYQKEFRMKRMNARLLAVVAVLSTASMVAESIMVVNDSKKDLKVVAAHKIMGRAVIIKPGEKAAINIDGFLSTMGAGQKLKFHQDGAKTYVMDVRFGAGKEEVVKYSQVQSGVFKPQVNPKTNHKEVRFVVTPLMSKAEKKKAHAKHEAGEEKAKKVKQDKKSAAKKENAKKAEDKKAKKEAKKKAKAERRKAAAQKKDAAK